MGIQAINGVSINGGGGGLTSVQVLTSSGDYTPTSGTRAIWVRLIGGGGGGGSSGSTVQTAVGGAAGGYAEEFIASAASAAFVIGAAGAGNASATGDTGGTTEFGSGPVLVQATGGAGGADTGANTQGIPAVGGVGSLGNILNVKGKRSGLVIPQITSPAHTIIAGDGADSPWGGGGDGPYSGTGQGYGAGGGARTQAGSSVGGTGSPGAIIVFEYV